VDDIVKAKTSFSKMTADGRPTPINVNHWSQWFAISAPLLLLESERERERARESERERERARESERERERAREQ